MQTCVLATVIMLAITCRAQSIADAARATQQQHSATNKRKVITNEDSPERQNTETPSTPKLDADTQAKMDHFRAVYMDICSDPSLQNAKTFPPEVKRRLEQAAEPLRRPVDRHPNIPQETKKLDQEEQAEVEAIASPVGKALTLEERKEIGAIRERYAAERQALAGAQAEDAQRSLLVLAQIVEMMSDCSKAKSAH